MGSYDNFKFRNVMPKGQVLRDMMAALDDFAVANVRDAGQPFATAVYIRDFSTGEMELVGGLRGGAEALTPDVVAELREKLKAKTVAHTTKTLHRAPEHELELIADPNMSVVLLSTAEAGPASHARQEILARALHRERLLDGGRFIVGFGAPWADSKGIGPDYEAVFDDMQNQIGQGSIKINSAPSPQMNEKLAAVFSNVTEPVAAVLLPDGTVMTGHAHDGITAESAAIAAAKEWQHVTGAADENDLTGAKLYTLTFMPGPVAYAEAAQAHIDEWIIAGPVPNQSKLMTKEAPDLSNRQLFELAAARPYNQPGTAVTVLQVPGFANRAQAQWRAMHAQQTAPVPQHS